MPATRIPSELIQRSFGLVATLENQRVVLPLKAVECEFSVAAGLVEVRMTQVFRQENARPLDCDYLFPLPADASVYCCEADFNGRVIRAVVKERGEAVRLAEEKKAEGRRVALVEAERENLFTLSLKNIQPDDLVVITLKYLQPLRHLAGMPSVEIPFCPGLRYIPGNPLIRTNRGKGVVDDTDLVPDASRITPVRLEKEHPDAAFVDIRGRLDGKFVEAAAIQSPSHDIISRPEGGMVGIRLSGKGEVPDRDFVLRWRETQPEQLAARAWLQETGGGTYALLEIRAPKAAGPAVPMDFYFLVDHSGSMEGIKWHKAAQAVKTCVAGLTEGDRMMLSLFSNGVRDFAEKPLPPSALLADANFQRLELTAPGGGTELGGALRHMLELAQTHSRGRERALILITDAQVGNDSDILKIMESVPDLRVHCFGIDLMLNDALLLALARQQQGTFHSLNPMDDVVKVISDLAATIRHPVLRELSLAEGWELSVEYLPTLFSEQVFHLSARSRDRRPLSLRARNGGSQAAELALACEPANSEAPGLHWCKHRIQGLISAGDEPAAIELSVKSNLICPLTAFIAWDESEKVAVASDALAQPVLHDAFEPLDFACCAAPEYEKGFSRMQGAGGSAHRSPMNHHNQLDGAEAHSYSHLITRAFKACDPREAVQNSLADAGSGLMSLPLPATLGKAERLAVFERFFKQIAGTSGLRALEPEFLAILQWTFADETQWLGRSELVARLLLELSKLAERQRLALADLCRELANLERKDGKPRLSFITVEAFTPGQSRTEAELLQVIEAEFKGTVDPGLVGGYFRIQGEMRQTLEAFVQKHVTP